MKLRKSLVILPLLALCLAGCTINTEETPGDSETSEESQTSLSTEGGTTEGGEEETSSSNTSSGTTEDTSEDETTSESTSEDDTGEDTTEDNTSESTSEDNTSDTSSGNKEIEEYNVVFTFYDTNGAVQKCPTYGSLYMQGNFADPTSSNWGSFLELSETTDLSGNTAYTYTFDQLVPGASYAFNVVFTNEGENPSWNPVRDNNFSAVLFSTTNDGDTEYISLTGCYNFDSRFGVKTASCTIAVNDTAQTGKSLMISGDFQGWQPTAMTYDASGTDYQYSYTFDVSENQALEFGIYTLSTWSDSIQVGTADADNYVTGTGANLKIDGKAIGSNSYTLIVFTVDGTNFGVTGQDHVRTSAITITH